MDSCQTSSHLKLVTIVNFILDFCRLVSRGAETDESVKHILHSGRRFEILTNPLSIWEGVDQSRNTPAMGSNKHNPMGTTPQLATPGICPVYLPLVQCSRKIWLKITFLTLLIAIRSWILHLIRGIQWQLYSLKAMVDGRHCFIW